MSDRLLDFWGLETLPFGDFGLGDDKLYYINGQYLMILNKIIRDILDHSNDIHVLFGETGTGKTALISRLIKALAFENVHVVYLVNPVDSEAILYTEILNQLTEEKSRDLRELYYLFDDYMEQIKKMNEQIVIILDEAQFYNMKMLDLITRFVNFNFKYKYLSLVLVGLPELFKTIKKCEHITSRIRVQYSLSRLTLEETKNYICHRYQASGGDSTIFSDLISKIYRASGGNPRLINNICSSLLIV